MGKVFISYAREDLRTAVRLYRDLKSRGAVPWLDKEDMLPGTHWESSIRAAIRKSSYFLALISRHSVGKRGFVHKEIRLALEVLEKLPSDEEVFILPVRLDSSKPSHEKLKELQWIDLFESYERGVARIAQSLDLSPPTAGSAFEERLQRIEKRLGSVFTPASPVERERLLQGRNTELKAIQRARRTHGKGVIIYGEEEVGKTSLAKAVERNTPGSYYHPLGGKDTFDSIARRILDFYGLPAAEDPLSTADMAAQLAPQEEALIFLDPFDVLREAERASFGELLGQLADLQSHSTLVFVGTAQSARELVPDPRVVRRNAQPLAVHPLAEGFLGQILDVGFQELAEVRLAPMAREYILEQAWRIPREIHRYGYNSTYALLDRLEGGDKEDFVVGLDECRLGETFDPEVG